MKTAKLLSAAMLFLVGCASVMFYPKTPWTSSNEDARAGRFSKPFEEVFNAVLDTLEAEEWQISKKDVVNGMITTNTKHVKGLQSGHFVVDLRKKQGVTEVKWKLYSLSPHPWYTPTPGSDGFLLNTKPEEIQNIDDYWNARLLKKLEE